MKIIEDERVIVNNLEKEFNNILNKKLNGETLSKENLKRLKELVDLINDKSIEESSEPIHEWFGLTYSSYLVLPRIFLQEMDKEWQVKFVKLLKELENEFNDPYDNYLVKPRINNKFVKDITNNYRRGSVEQFRKK